MKIMNIEINGTSFMAAGLAVNLLAAPLVVELLPKAEDKKLWADVPTFSTIGVNPCCDVKMEHSPHADGEQYEGEHDSQMHPSISGSLLPPSGGGTKNSIFWQYLT